MNVRDKSKRRLKVEFLFTALAAFFLLTAGAVPLRAAEPNAAPQAWPCWRGSNRDGIALVSPKLAEHWPKEGPPLAWKSEWIPGFHDWGGCGCPVVADGKVFLYASWRLPSSGGDKYVLITTDLLKNWGWNPDLPEELAKKIEAAWSAKERPTSSGWRWYDVDWCNDPKDKELDEFLAKTPALDKYIKDFVAALPPSDAAKFGVYIKRRLCISTEQKWALPRGYTWEQLTKLSTIKDAKYATPQDCKAAVKKLGIELPGVQPSRTGSGWRCVEWERVLSYSDTVICMDAATGKTLWKRVIPLDANDCLGDSKKFGALLTRGKFDSLGASATMAVWNDKCYAVGVGGLYCLNAKTGAVLWTVPGNPEHASPLVVDGLVYHCGSAYDAETGALRWKSEAWKPGSSLAYTSAAIWIHQGKKFVVASNGANALVCLEAETGKPVWSLAGAPAREQNSPVVIGDTMFVIAANPVWSKIETRGYKLSPAGAELVWKNAVGAGHHIACNGYVYVYSSPGEFQAPSLKCLDAKTGELKWTGPGYPDAEEGWSSSFAADGKVFNVLGRTHGAYNSRMEMIHAESGTDGKYTQLSEFSPGICPLSSPAFANGFLFLRLNDCVACYDLRAK